MGESLRPWFQYDLDGEEPQLGPLPPNLEYRRRETEAQLAQLLEGLVELEGVERQGTLFDPNAFKER